MMKNLHNHDLYIAPKGQPDLIKKADSLDREWLYERVKNRTWEKVILNDEELENSGILLTVSHTAWKELENLV